MATPHCPGRRATDDSGAAAVEYAILVSLIAGIVIGAVLTLGNTTGLIFSLFAQGWPK